MILVTGSTGFIGRSVTNALTLAGREWRPFKGRLNLPANIRDHLDGIHTVIHLAGAEARGRGRLLHHVDVDGTQRLLEELTRSDIKRIIVPSRINANPNDIHPLLRAKGEVERSVRHSGVDYTILRSSTLFGYKDRFTEMVLSLALWTWPFVWLPGGGTTAMQPLWVEDFARCIIFAIDNPSMRNKTITVAGSERFRYADLMRLILSNTGTKRLPVKLPMSLLRPSASFLYGWWYWPPVTRFFVDRFFVPEVAELDSVTRHFGFRPARLGETMAYLHRPGMRRRLFQR